MAANRIAIISPRYPNPESGAIGGCETLLLNLAEHLAAAGREVHFITTCANNHHSWDNSLPPGSEVINGVNVHYYEVNEDRDLESFLRVQDNISQGRKIPMEDQMLWRDNSVNSRSIEQHIQEEGDGYDAILIGPYLLGLTMRVALIKPERTYLVPCLHDEAFAYLEIMKELFQSCKGISFNAHAEKALAERLYGIPTDKGHVVGMGMEDFEFDKEKFKREMGIDCPYIMYCGRREGLKGTPLMFAYIDTFIQRTGRDLKLVLAGVGSDAPEDTLMPHIIDLGFCSEEAKHTAMAGAHVFMHPSVNESFGIVLLESFLTKTPAIVNGQGAVLTDHCQRSNGGLWFRNYPEFEDMLIRLLDDTELHRAMGEAGRQYVLNEYSWDAIMQKLTAAIDG